MKDLWKLDVEELKKLHQQESARLEQSLLNGALWEEVTEQRKRIGELSNVIYKKSNPAQFDPAENFPRNRRNIKGNP